MVDPSMLDVLLQPLSLYVLALGTGFLIPLFYRAGPNKAVLGAVFHARQAHLYLFFLNTARRGRARHVWFSRRPGRPQAVINKTASPFRKLADHGQVDVINRRF